MSTVVQVQVQDLGYNDRVNTSLDFNVDSGTSTSTRSIVTMTEWQEVVYDLSIGLVSFSMTSNDRAVLSENKVAYFSGLW